jgi:hypothetical protein
VLVNDLGVLITSVPHDDDDDIELLEERMWWPARVSIPDTLEIYQFTQSNN